MGVCIERKFKLENNQRKYKSLRIRLTKSKTHVNTLSSLIRLSILLYAYSILPIERFKESILLTKDKVYPI